MAGVLPHFAIIVPQTLPIGEARIQLRGTKAMRGSCDTPHGGLNYCFGSQDKMGLQA
jgi:hypothetical protein